MPPLTCLPFLIFNSLTLPWLSVRCDCTLYHSWEWYIYQYYLIGFLLHFGDSLPNAGGLMDQDEFYKRARIHLICGGMDSGWIDIDAMPIYVLPQLFLQHFPLLWRDWFLILGLQGIDMDAIPIANMGLTPFVLISLLHPIPCQFHLGFVQIETKPPSKFSLWHRGKTWNNLKRLKSKLKVFWAIFWPLGFAQVWQRQLPAVGRPLIIDKIHLES